MQDFNDDDTFKKLPGDLAGGHHPVHRVGVGSLFRDLQSHMLLHQKTKNHSINQKLYCNKFSKDFTKIQSSCLFFKINFCLCCVFVAVHGFSLVVVSGAYSLVEMRGVLTAEASRCGEPTLQTCGLQQLRCAGLVVVVLGLSCLWHVESSQTRDQTCVPALAAGFLTTGPPGKSWQENFFLTKIIHTQDNPF